MTDASPVVITSRGRLLIFIKHHISESYAAHHMLIEIRFWQLANITCLRQRVRTRTARQTLTSPYSLMFDRCGHGLMHPYQ
jgi:hypothetical protein